MTKRLNAPREVFLVVAVIVTVSTALIYWYGRTVIRAHRIAASRHAAIAQLQHVLSIAKDAETGQRGFVITGDESYLNPYNAAIGALPEELGKIQQLEVLSARSSEMARLRQTARQKLEELNATINLRRSGGFDAAASVVANGRGKQLMDEMRTLIGDLQSEQEQLLAQDNAAANELTRRRTFIFLLNAVISIAFLYWAYRRIRNLLAAREAARREAEERRIEAQRQREYLSVTLTSIGDCVMVADTSGRITFMNRMAEQLTGWDLESARAHPTEEVFKIINEETRAPVENPVEKVIRYGVVVGLANHTLLVRRDGTEVPIDDSGAPIRDEQGNLHGVVLVFRDFTERKQFERALREAKEVAETANRAKDHFLATLSHELRTPLTPVLTTLSLWEASDEIPDEIKTDVQMLRRSVELEARIIDDLLDLTRIARGIMSFSPETTDVHELIQFIVNLSQSSVYDKGQQITLELNAERHFVWVDASRLQQVLWNIVRNAVKFTERGGEITITTNNDAQENIVVCVSDTGIGMTREKLEQLFVPFTQTTRAGADVYGGLGLGLSIARALVDLLGGKIEAQSEGLGLGSTFTIKFATVDTPASRNLPRSESLPPRPEGPLRILLVEDHQDTARALFRLLTKRGYEVDTADSVASGIVKVEQGTFDLLLCDIGLPDGTGFELIEHVRKTCDTPALALSGFGSTQDVNRSKQAGFEAHLTKPVNFQRLEATIWQLTNAKS